MITIVEVFIYFVLLVIGIKSFKRTNYSLFISVFYLLITDCIGFLSECPLHGRDCALLIVVILLLGHFSKGKRIINRNDSVGYSVCLLIGWFLIRTLISILNGDESIINALLVVRFEIFFICYFAFLKFDYQDIRKAIPFIFMTTYVGAVYLLYVTYIEGDSMAIAPGGLEICLFISVFDKTIKHRKLNIVFFMLLLFVGTSRGLLIALILSPLIYFLFVNHSKLKIRPKYLVFTVVLFSLITPFFINKLSQDVGKGAGLIEESGTIMEMLRYQSFDEYDHSMVYTEGTFAFRFALVAERVNYLINHPKDLLFGLGSIHEDTAQRLFHFSLGTYRGKGEEYVQGQIDTGDISYITEWLRFGLVYILLFFNLVSKIIKRIRISQLLLYKIAIFLMIEMLVRSVSSVPFMGSDFSFYFVLMVAASIYGPRQYTPIQQIQINKT